MVAVIARCADSFSIAAMPLNDPVASVARDGGDRDARRGWFAPEQWMRELRHAARVLRRAPGFSLAVFFTLVICIGPNTAILSALYALVLKPLPFPDPAQLIVVTNVAGKNGGQTTMSSVPQYRDFKEHADLFAGFAVIQHQNITLDNEDTVMRVPNDWVSADFFDVLGVKPLRGRLLAPAEETPGRDLVLGVAEEIWIQQ
jgi:hypothetical protein